MCVCVCCAFAALIPFNTNRIERCAISCDENINKKQHTEKQKTHRSKQEKKDEEGVEKGKEEESEHKYLLYRRSSRHRCR